MRATKSTQRRPTHSKEWYANQANWFAAHAPTEEDAINHRRIAKILETQIFLGKSTLTSIMRRINEEHGWATTPEQPKEPAGIKTIYNSLAVLTQSRDPDSRAVLLVDSATKRSRLGVIGPRYDRTKWHTKSGIWVDGYSPYDIVSLPVTQRRVNASAPNLIVWPIINRFVAVSGKVGDLALPAINLTELEETDGSKESFPYPDLIVGRTAIENWAEQQADNADDPVAAEIARLNLTAMSKLDGLLVAANSAS